MFCRWMTRMLVWYGPGTEDCGVFWLFNDDVMFECENSATNEYLQTSYSVNLLINNYQIKLFHGL